MRHIHHPREFIREVLAEELRSSAFEAEQLQKLHDKQLAIIQNQNWFNLYVPKVHGGLGMSIPQILRIEEALAWADGSSAWVVTLCSGAAWFVGFLEPELAVSIFKSDKVCFAGSGAVTGIANRTAAGYEINGYWPYATGSLHATVFTVNCLVREGGEQIYSADGSPAISSFVLRKGEVEIHRTWHAMGMIATGSHSIEVKSTTIPLSRAFTIHPANATLKDEVFQFPFLQLAETTLAVNLSGMAYRFLELCEDVFSKKENDMLTRKIFDGRDRLNGARQDFYFQTDAAWHRLVSALSIPGSVLVQVSNASHSLVHSCRDVVNDLYSYCGLDAADTRNEINRVWRNFHTAGQHSLFRDFRLKSNSIQ